MRLIVFLSNGQNKNRHWFSTKHTSAAWNLGLLRGGKAPSRFERGLGAATREGHRDKRGIQSFEKAC
jgi:hypothetical protein